MYPISRRGRERAHQGTADLAGHLKALIALLRQHAIEHHRHLFRHVGAVAANRLRCLGELLRENVGGRRAIEGWRAGEHLVEHDAEGVDVGATVERISGRLFGAHVLRRADDGAFTRELRGRPGLFLLRRLRGLGDTEVRHQDVAALVQQDVVRLDVAVDDLVAVRVGERVGHLARNTRRVADVELLLRLEQLAQRRTVDAPHDDVEDLFVPADLVNRHDMGMLEARDGLCFVHEALGGRRGRRELDIEHLHRDVAIQHVIARAKHGGEAPLTQQRANRKFRAKRLL